VAGGCHDVQGFDIEARPADAGAIGPASWYHVGSDQLGDILAAILSDTNAILTDTATLPADPASETNVDANETKIDTLQSSINALNDLAQSDILDDATPFSGADIAAILTDTNEIQGKLPSGNICNEPDGSRAVVIHTQEADTTTIQQAAVTLWSDSNRTVLVARVTTDVSGDASVSLDDGTYYYTAVKSLYTFVAGSFVVSGNGTHNVTGVSVAPASPSSPDLCVIFGTILDASGDPIASETVTASIRVPADIDGNQLGSDEVTATTDSNGYFELELIRESVVNFTIPAVRIFGSYTVPDAASQDITTWTAN
jgi:hypothetical protein